MRWQHETRPNLSSEREKFGFTFSAKATSYITGAIPIGARAMAVEVYVRGESGRYKVEKHEDADHFFYEGKWLCIAQKRDTGNRIIGYYETVPGEDSHWARQLP